MLQHCWKRNICSKTSQKGASWIRNWCHALRTCQQQMAEHLQLQQQSTHAKLLQLLLPLLFQSFLSFFVVLSFWLYSCIWSSAQVALVILTIHRKVSWKPAVHPTIQMLDWDIWGCDNLPRSLQHMHKPWQTRIAWLLVCKQIWLLAMSCQALPHFVALS